MNFGLERKLKRDLFCFCLLHSRFYEGLERYIPSETAYRDVVASYLAEGWVIRSERLWYAALPPDVLLPQQGFKIHLSATTATAMNLLRKVTPILVGAKTAFKFVADPTMLDYQNSKNYPRAQSGKFVTVYPRDEEQCKTLLALLHAVTEDLKGPHILSDRPFRGSKVVFYRYGSFVQRSELTLYGDSLPVILHPDGHWVPDVREPSFQLPAGMADPFQPESMGPPPVPLLNSRYTVESAESFSNSGGVYQGRDSTNERRVIIKEARPGTCTSNGSPNDATDTLKKEYRVLLTLQSTGYVPAALDYFHEWDHQFLVEEYVEGMPLSKYRALEEAGLVVNRTGAADLAEKFSERLRTITRNLIQAVEACHEKGVVLGDLSPDNVLIDEKSLAIRLIDFEGATIRAESSDPDHAAMATLGFASPNRMRGGPVAYDDDWYSLGALIYSLILPLQPFFHLHPPAQELFLREVVKDQALPTEISDLISALFETHVLRAKNILADDFVFPELANSTDELPTPEKFEEVLQGITEYILRTKDLSRNDRLFPSDYRVFSTNPLSIAYGAIGQALYLQSTKSGVPQEVNDWLLRQPVCVDNYAPGLYIGLSGVAWGLAELGNEDSARDAMDKAYQSALLHNSLDLFYGCAGTGIASIYWWYRTGDGKFLEKACELGDHILRAAVEDPVGYYWLNIDGGHHFGYAHGGSGISLFLLYLHRAKGDSRYLQYAVGGLDYEIAQAREEAGYLIWRRGKDDNLWSPYWRYGSAGIGSVLIRFYAILQDQRYLMLADKAARYATTKFAGFPGQFMGLSGMGEFLLDMYRFTGRTHYRDEALEIAAGVLLYAVPEQQGTAFPGEELMRLSTDYGTGSAGIGMFLRRLLQPGSRLFHDLLLEDLVVGREGVLPAVEAERSYLQCAR